MKTDISPAEELFIVQYLAHGNAALAAREAGFPQVGNLLKNTVIREQIDIRRSQTAKEIRYDCKTAMLEARRGMVFAHKVGNATAYAKCIELRAKLMGLLIERVDVNQRGAFVLRIEGIDLPPTPLLSLPGPTIVSQAPLPPPSDLTGESDLTSDLTGDLSSESELELGQLDLAEELGLTLPDRKMDPLPKMPPLPPPPEQTRREDYKIPKMVIEDLF